MGSSLEIENGKKYVNPESVPVEYIRYSENSSFKRPRLSALRWIGAYLIWQGVPHGSGIVSNDEGIPYLITPDSYKDVDEENPQEGDYFVIFPNKKVVLYTSAEFDANFKMV